MSFVRNVAIVERKDDEGALLGDRVTVCIEDGTLHLYRESKLIHAPGSGLGAHDWDWQVDPDAGITVSLEGARELCSALVEGLGGAPEGVEWSAVSGLALLVGLAKARRAHEEDKSDPSKNVGTGNALYAAQTKLNQWMDAWTKK